MPSLEEVFVSYFDRLADRVADRILARWKREGVAGDSAAEVAPVLAPAAAPAAPTGPVLVAQQAYSQPVPRVAAPASPMNPAPGRRPVLPHATQDRPLPGGTYPGAPQGSTEVHPVVDDPPPQAALQGERQAVPNTNLR